MWEYNDTSRSIEIYKDSDGRYITYYFSDYLDPNAKDIDIFIRRIESNGSTDKYPKKYILGTNKTVIVYKKGSDGIWDELLLPKGKYITIDKLSSFILEAGKNTLYVSII